MIIDSPQKVYIDPPNDNECHYLVLEIEGDATVAEDFLSMIEKLEREELACATILNMKQMLKTVVPSV